MRISIALSTYNGERFLERQLASLATQDRPPDELVVRDDGSTDDTLQILQAFAATARFPVTLIRGEARLGSTPSFEVALMHCTGEVIALCDQDDVWRADKLRVIERAFAARPEVGLVFSDAHLIDADGACLRHLLWQVQRPERRGWAIRRSSPPVVLGPYSVPGCTIAFQTRFTSLYLPFPAAIRARTPPAHHDWWIATTVVAAAPVQALPEPLVDYRLHEGQQIGLGPRSRGAGRMAWILRVQRGRVYAARASSELGRLICATPVLRRYCVERRGVTLDRLFPMLEEFFVNAHFRQNLPQGRRARARRVVAAWRSGAYHRFANGVWSVAADLLSPPPQPPPGGERGAGSRHSVRAPAPHRPRSVRQRRSGAERVGRTPSRR